MLLLDSLSTQVLLLGLDSFGYSSELSLSCVCLFLYFFLLVK